METMSAEQLLDAQVMADIMGTEAPASPEGPVGDLPAINVEPLAVTPEVPAPAQPEAKAETQEEKAVREAKEFAFKHRGQEVSIKLTPEQELEYIQKGHDYTAKTMELA